MIRTSPSDPLFTDLDDTPPAKNLARREDPEESKKAAREIAPKLSALHDLVFDLVKRYPASTANELATIADARDPRHIGRRLPELAANGRIFKCGSRPCRITGKSAAIWRPTT